MVLMVLTGMVIVIMIVIPWGISRRGSLTEGSTAPSYSHLRKSGGNNISLLIVVVFTPSIHVFPSMCSIMSVCVHLCVCICVCVCVCVYVCVCVCVCVYVCVYPGPTEKHMGPPSFFFISSSSIPSSSSFETPPSNAQRMVALVTAKR
jgi:hypothetical protein